MGGHYRRFWAMGLALAFLGCDSLTDLEVVNQNNPETVRVLATAADLEGLIGGTFLTYWNGTQQTSPFGTLSVQADEGSASWGNWGMRDQGFEPRTAYNNSPTYSYRNVNRRPWNNMYGALSSAADGLIALRPESEGGGGVEIGAGGKDNPRAIAFAKFVQGMSLGWLALQFDKAIIFDEDVDLAAAAGGEFEFVPYGEVMTAALTKMDEAIAIAAANTFTLDPDWVAGMDVGTSEFIRMMHSFKARLMTHVARSPAEEATINWAAVLSEINAGITEDLVFTADRDPWVSAWTRWANEGVTWMRADYKTIGYTDRNLGPNGYVDWLATPVGDRLEFEMDTPDLRIWGCGIDGDLGGQCRSVDGSTSRDARIGGSRGQANDQEPGLYFRFFGSSPFPAARGTMVWSNYHFWRYEDVFENSSRGPMRHILMEEMDLLRAEAYIRTGQPALAMDIINATRVPAGLAAVDVNGAPCPPAVPGCDLMDQLIYEKRMETWNTNSGGAYFDRRRWGNPAPTSTHHRGLVEGTPLHYPVPGTELEVLELPTYTFGGVGSEGSPNIGSGSMSRMTARYEDIYAFEPGMTLTEKLAFVEEHFRNDGSDLLTRYR